MRLGSQTGMNPPFVTIATRVEQDPDEREREARLLAVHPQPGEQEQRSPPANSGSRKSFANAMPPSIANWVM